MYMIKSITVFCASSTQTPEIYRQQTRRLGDLLADADIQCYYGGGRVGLMGDLAQTMVRRKAKITGIIPEFMVKEGWDNADVEELVVPDMYRRKDLLLNKAEAIVALAGGCGTLDELMEAITAKQLGLIHVPIVILNVNGYFDSLLSMLNRAVEEHFMRPEHKSLWSVVNTADEVLPAIEDSSVLPNARGLAAI